MASTTELTGEVIVSSSVPDASTPRTAPLMNGAPLLWSVVTVPPCTTAVEVWELPVAEKATVACSSRATFGVLVSPIAVDFGATR